MQSNIIDIIMNLAYSEYLYNVLFIILMQKMAKKPTIDGLIDCYDWQHFLFSFPPSEAWLTQNDVPKSRNFENLMIKLNVFRVLC